QNAAMVEQTTASTHGLANEAEALFELLSRFNLGTKMVQTGRPASTQAASPSPARKSKTSPQHDLTDRLRANFPGAATARQAENWSEF
ncbi:MAG: hypothetical protein RID59_19475, partial [Hoeflea sp.]